METTINQLVKIISVVILFGVIAATSLFTYQQIQQSRIVDETLVSDLTTRLETTIIDQAINKITPASQ